MRTHAVILIVSIAFAAAELPWLGDAVAAQTTKKKKKKKAAKKTEAKKEEPKKEETKAEPKKEERRVVKPVEPPAGEAEKKEEPAEEEKLEVEQPPPMTPEQLEEQRVEAAKKKIEAERRQQSKVTPGAPSRWSNRGAMVPVASTVQVTADLPERAVPITEVVTTPGQDLLGGGREEILSARLSFGFYHLSTQGQDQVFVQAFDAQPGTTNVATLIPGEDRDIQFLRARATMGYDHIAGSDFAVHLDVEYRPQINGTRFTDYRLNEAYASYGLTEFKSSEGPWWGLALGRLAIREAGYAQADGLAARFRIVDWLRAGLFGGVTGNPYGYNWNQRNTEVFSANWYTGGAFVSLQIPQLIVNVAGVVTYANIAVNLADIDRAYVYLDGAWLILPELNFAVNGWIDVLSGGQVVQNIHGTLSWTPWNELSLALGGGRFSTLLYAVSADNYTFVANGDNEYENLGNVVSETDTPIVPFDAVLMTTTYNTVWVRGGYRILRELEVTAKYDVLIRDSSVNQPLLQAQVENVVEPSALRMLPGLGVRYRNPEIVDVNLEGTYIIDDESQADAVISGGIGRALFGFYLNADVRYYVGEIGAWDAGALLSYTFPRDWFPGALSLRGMFRYFQEHVAVYTPTPGVAPTRADTFVDGWNLIKDQNSILGFAGIEWRL